ncbi:hypothetical protein NUU61_002045 [Penicillium alfredii]|uniref:Chromatin assembly factor 1 subunit A n=1 Tax=Penicillium alfredii TaxID=1506179 RepID=A0A9W9KGG9_9EURO|nr:uncharacterized protein NUU61_002045 [Penicillium alfredii]KAJ5104698.1 hypothetical protein NUU61_002045 [Penicillium alfredii]
MTLSPLPHPQAFPASPSTGPRKRSFHEVDDVAMASPGAKRTLTEFNGENQENRDPSLLAKPDEIMSQSDESNEKLPPPPTVEITVKPYDGSAINFADTPSGQLDTEKKSSAVGNVHQADSAAAPAAKKRKLSPSSKESKQHEKEEKERQKAEEKLKREEEKARKEEEKRLKAEEKKKRDAEREEEKRAKEEEKRKRETEREEERKQREEKKKAKEEEKAAREEEKRKREEEKMKKSRSQMKLNSFFAKPPGSSAPASNGNPFTSPSKSSVISETGAADAPHSVLSDYRREFPDFFVQSHTTLAPTHRFERDSEALKHVRQTVDAFLAHPQEPQPFHPSEVFHTIPYHRRRGLRTATVKQILLQMQDASDATTQLGENHKSTADSKPHDLLRRIPMKSLKFSEDVRPPYQGTYTRVVSEGSAKKLSRNPYHRGLPDTNYEYDSEAEWEEPEEGEDLDSEEEEEGSDEGDDDLDGFLDDEDDAFAGGKRRLIVGDLEPVCSGIQWAADGVDPEFKNYQIETISDAVRFPIDPFSTAYWQRPRATDQGPTKGRAVPSPLNISQTPPSLDGPTVGGALPPTMSKLKRPFPPDQLEEFKQVVEGSDLSKIGVVEILKKRYVLPWLLLPKLENLWALLISPDAFRFPKVSKETLKATLDQVAVRVGNKEADKKWVCR